MGLKDVAEWLHYCPRCNSCKYLYRIYDKSCPAFEKFKFEPYTASGKVWMARDLYEGRYPLSESIRDKVFSCTLCGNCSEQCQQEISNHHLDVFEALREECATAGLSLPAHKIIRENIEKNHNPYGDSADKRFEGIDSKYFKENADVLVFIGCTTALRNKSLLQDILSLLDLLGINFTLSKEEWCCGSPLLTTGQTSIAEQLAHHNADLIKALGVKTVITACAGCFRSLKSQYPKKFGVLSTESDKKSQKEKSPKGASLEILHISQYLNQAIKKGIFTKTDPVVITYHDPCHLGRHMGVYEDPRQVLRQLKGVKLIEMPRNRENAWCCGAGAGVKSAFKDWAVEIAEDRVKEALSINTEKIGPIRYIITTCPFCERNLMDGILALRQKGFTPAKDIEILDLIQFLKTRI